MSKMGYTPDRAACEGFFGRMTQMTPQERRAAQRRDKQRRKYLLAEEEHQIAEAARRRTKLDELQREARKKKQKSL